MARLDIKESTLKKLFALSGNRCAFPGCDKHVVNELNDLIADICHIEGAEERGERFNPSQTDEQRRSFENLLILCPTHHRQTDNVAAYPVAELQRMKREHEANFAARPFELTESQWNKLRDRLSGIATSGLPHGTDALVGREEWIQRIEDAWHDPHVHVVSIVAQGGIGKTALAVEWMTRLAARNWPGIEH